MEIMTSGNGILNNRSDKMERNFAKLHSDVCFKRANGKVIWQPRIDCWIADKMFENGELPGIYKGMSKVDIYCVFIGQQNRQLSRSLDIVSETQNSVALT